MSIEENKALVRRFVEVTNHPDWEALYRAEWPGGDTEALIAMHAPFRAAFPDYQYTVENMVAEGDKVAVQGTVRATHSGEFPFGELQGVAPTGKRLEWAEMWFIQLVDGRITPVGFVLDGVSRLQQLGVLSAPAESEPV